MKAKVKIINPYALGVNSIENFDSIADLKKFLNETLYYNNEVLLYIDCWEMNEVHKYSEVNDVAGLVSEANHYDSILCILPTLEQ